MERNKLFFRHVLLHYFDLKKTAAAAHKLLFEAYGNYVPSERTCQVWFQRFKSGDFDVNDKERSGQPKKFEDTDLQALLDENSTQTLQELSAALNVTLMAVSKRLHAMGKIQMEGKWEKPQELSLPPNIFVGDIRLIANSFFIEHAHVTCRRLSLLGERLVHTNGHSERF